MNVRVPTFQYPSHRRQPPVFSANSLVCSSLCQNVVLLRPFHTRKEMKITGSQVWEDDGGDQTLPIENSSGASLLQLQYAAEHCHEEGQCMRTTFLVACSEYRIRITARTPHLAGDYCFRHAYGLTTRSVVTSAMCSDRRAY